MKLEELKIRLKERIRVYQDSPNMTVTYVDLSHVLEDLLVVIKEKKINGFNKE